MTTTLCMNPGPVEFDSSVLSAMSHVGISHVDSSFLNIFGECLEMFRSVCLASPTSQPVILSGSGTLGWEIVSCNFITKGDKVLVINTGYFGDAFGEALGLNGAVVTHLRASVGDVPTMKSLKDILSKEKFKMVTITHVDTSTGVLTDLQKITSIIRKAQKDTVVVVDSVCALGGEELRMEDWDLDIVLTGSQKCLGVPAGLCLAVLSPHALAVFNERTSLPSSYYASLTNWLPIMQKYEKRQPSYFATPAVNHFYALHVALSILLKNGGMESRFTEHVQVSTAIKNSMTDMGCSFVPLALSKAANTMTCVRYPANVKPAEFLKEVTARGVSLAGGLHKSIKMEYFRIGHMGPSTRRYDHILKTVTAIEGALVACGHTSAAGKGKMALLELEKTCPKSACCTFMKWGRCPVPVVCQCMTISIIGFAFGLGVVFASSRK